MTTKTTRITLTPSQKHHDYLEKQVEETGMPKTAIIQMALEKMIQQDEQLDTLQKMMAEVELQRIEEQYKETEPKK